jgi:DNA-binding transcriptional MerR regulator
MMTLKFLYGQLGVSKAWIDKVQKMFRVISGASGTPGQKSTYSDEEYEFFRRILVLRAIGLNLKYIKEFFELENRIGDLIRINYGTLLDKEERRKFAQLPGRVDGITKMGFFQFYLTGGLIYPNNRIEFSNYQFQKDLKEGKEDAIQIERLLEQRGIEILNISSRMDKVLGFAGKEKDILSRMS